MSLLKDIQQGIRHLIVMEERVKDLRGDIEKLATRVGDHEKRLIRIETMIEMAQRPRRDDRLIGD